MKLTTKIAIGGVLLIGFIFWLSFWYLNPGDVEVKSAVMVVREEEGMEWYPEGVDVVMTLDGGANQDEDYVNLKQHWYYRVVEGVADKMARGELRKGMNKAVDYFQFVLRSVDERVRFYRFLVLVIPDGVLIPQYLNMSSPKLKIVKHSDFIPLQYLPTFNPEMVKVYLHKIPGISNDFIFLNENTFFLSDVELSLFRKLDTGSYIVRTIENAFFPKSGFIKDASRAHTYATYPSPIPSHLKFDTLSPVLLNRPFLTRLLENEYPLLVQNISTHKFLLPDQISMLEFYLIHLVQAHPPPSQPKDSKDSKLNLVFEDSLLKVLEDIEKNSNQIDNWRSKNKILNIPDILLLNLHQQAEIGSLLYTLYPNLSRLEVDVEDYSRIGLFVAIMFWFGGITICYTFTRMMGGHIKEDAFGGKREL